MFFFLAFMLHKPKMSLNWQAKPYFLNPAEEWNLHPPQQRQFSETASVTTEHFAALVNLLAVKSVLCLDFHVKIKCYKILNVVIIKTFI